MLCLSSATGTKKTGDLWKIRLCKITNVNYIYIIFIFGGGGFGFVFINKPTVHSGRVTGGGSVAVDVAFGGDR